MTFYEALTAAVKDFTEHGFNNQERLEHWMRELELAAKQSMIPESAMRQQMTAAFQGVYRRLVENGGIAQYHPGVGRFTLQQVMPKLRAELDRRIMASANLIKLNREAAIQKTLQRFSGWATSIPAGGSKTTEKIEEKDKVRKSLAQLPFEERRVLIDQTHKLTTALNETMAVGGGAIAARWFSHYRQPGYDYREDHKERDGEVYAIRGNWALEKGLMKPGKAGYTDDITKPGEEVFCFPGNSKIPFADNVEKCFRRWYSGDLTEIVTSSNKTLRATPNHPVLTSRGWIAIGLLKEGDNVVEISDDLGFSSKEYENDAIPLISEIFSTLNKDNVIESFSASATELNGDVFNCNVNIVEATRHLSFGVKPLLYKFRENLSFSKSNNSSSANRSHSFSLFSVFFAAPRFVGILHKLFSPFFSCRFKTNEVCFATSACCYPDSAQPSLKSPACYSEIVRNTFKAFAGFVTRGNLSFIKRNSVWFFDSFSKVKVNVVTALEKQSDLDADNWSYLAHGHALPTQFSHIVKINKSHFSGHVYNLQTKHGWYVTQNIFTHNCRCQYKYIYNLRSLPDSMLTAKGREQLKNVKVA